MTSNDNHHWAGNRVNLPGFRKVGPVFHHLQWYFNFVLATKSTWHLEIGLYLRVKHERWAQDIGKIITMCSTKPGKWPPNRVGGGVCHKVRVNLPVCSSELHWHVKRMANHQLVSYEFGNWREIVCTWIAELRLDEWLNTNKKILFGNW